MTFQKSVARQYTAGFPGELFRDGPTRAKPAIIVSATVGVDPGASTNRISRAFGYSADLPPVGNVANPLQSTNAVIEQQVVVGGATFFGVLFHPKHYALLGTTNGGTLAPSLDLPKYATAEFCDMGILVAELFNETTGAKTMNYGDGVAYVPSNITAGNNPLALPYGALVSYPAGGAVPTGMVAIPNARVVNTAALGASAVGALVSGYTAIQLTQ